MACFGQQSLSGSDTSHFHIIAFTAHVPFATFPFSSGLVTSNIWDDPCFLSVDFQTLHWAESPDAT